MKSRVLRFRMDRVRSYSNPSISVAEKRTFGALPVGIVEKEAHPQLEFYGATSTSFQGPVDPRCRISQNARVGKGG